MEIALDPLLNRTGDVWHACIASLRDVGTLCYGWRADADISWDAETGSTQVRASLCQTVILHARMTAHLVTAILLAILPIQHVHLHFLQRISVGELFNLAMTCKSQRYKHQGGE